MLLVLLGGCVTIHDPQSADTKFNDRDRDWVVVFTHEINVAIENDDAAAYHFFMQELLSEKIQIWKAKKINKP